MHQNQKSNIMIVYSLKIHTALQLRGFKYIGTMPNPKNEQYNCWMYEKSPAFVEAFNEIVKGGSKYGR